ncbi:MAG TPA: hypothetical protein VHB79_28380 [Polyangiaceae bacterium]|nr:hypothetical protein [Polyangiaceae bacterium]
MATAPKLQLALALSAASLGCSDPLRLGDDVVWSADQENGSLAAWTAGDSGGTRLPSSDCTVAVSSAAAHGGRASIELVNPAAWERMDEGPELFHDVGAQVDAYYSAWFMLKERYRIDPWLTLMQLSSRDSETDGLHSAEQLQLRSLPSGGYVLQVYNDNAGALLEPLSDPAPQVEAARWFQIEARFEPHDAGRLRIWLDGALIYDLGDRPGATGAHQVLSVSNVAEKSTPAPLVLYVDDAAVSLSRVSPNGTLHD